MLACFAALVRRFGLFFFYPSALFGLRSSVVCSISGESLNRYPLNHYIISATGIRSYMMLLGLLQRLLE
ncbi:unnamed protein product [Arabidopsis lyrata]|nr:unnamed protein product [Arabidopsis lyrata]